MKNKIKIELTEKDLSGIIESLDIALDHLDGEYYNECLEVGERFDKIKKEYYHEK